MQNSLTVSNIQLASVVSDTFGKSAQAILSHLLEHPGDTEFDFLPLLHGSMRKNQEQIALAIDETISPVQADKIQICQHHMNLLEEFMTRLESLADSIARTYSSVLMILESIPGVAHISALVILSEIGADTAFKSARHLCSWAGGFGSVQ